MQHDTSPHEVEVGGSRYKSQTASAVLCYSRLLFFQIYPAFQRFDCKVFLTEALKYMGGSPERVMIDNTHVVVLRGTGSEMIPVPEMETFAERFGSVSWRTSAAMPTARHVWNDRSHLSKTISSPGVRSATGAI